MTAYSIPAASVGHLAAFFYYAYTPMQLPVGVLIDRFGPKRMLSLAAFCSAMGTLLFTHSSILNIAQLGRFLIGFGSAFAFIGVLKLATIWFNEKHFAMVTGFVITAGTATAMVGNVLMGWMVQFYGWKTTLNILANIGLLLTPMIWIFVNDYPKHHSSKDISFKSTAAKYNPNIEKSYPFYLLLQNSFKFIRSSHVWINALIGCLLFLPTSIFNELWGHSCLLTLHNINSSTASSAIAMTFFGWAVGSPIVCLLANKIKNRKILIQSACIINFCLLCLILYFSPLTATVLHITLFLLGLASSPQILILVIAKESCKPELVASSLAFTNFIIMSGGLICQPLVGKLMDLFLMKPRSASFEFYTGESYIFALSILPLGLVIAFALSFLLGKDPTGAKEGI